MEEVTPPPIPVEISAVFDLMYSRKKDRKADNITIDALIKKFLT